MGKLKEVMKQGSLRDALEQNEWVETSIPFGRTVVGKDIISVRYYVKNKERPKHTWLELRIGLNVVKKLGWKLPLGLTIFTSKMDATVLCLAPTQSGGRKLALPAKDNHHSLIKFPFHSPIPVSSGLADYTEFEVDENKLIFRLI
jgi:hypothetical protein